MGFGLEKEMATLVGCSPWGRKESGMTEQLTLTLMGFGNPLQYSCLENPMDGGTWVSAVHGVTQSQTQLK